MAVRLFLQAHSKPKGFFGAKPQKSDILSHVRQAFEGALTDPLMKKFFLFDLQDDRMLLVFHPAEDPVEFSFGEGERLLCSAKTNSAGPGYHAFLVETLEKVAEECRLTWEWRDPEGGPGDETGFPEHRNFAGVQERMLDWLRNLAGTVLESYGSSQTKNLQISLPTDILIEGDYFAASPMGFWPVEWFEKVLIADAEGLISLGSRFFPWWNKGIDGLFWKNCGLAMAWFDIPWHHPASDDEESKYRLVLECFERARLLDGALALPEEEIMEIRALLEKPASERPAPPKPGLIGFKRGMVRQFLGGPWSIALPGYFYTDSNREGTELIFWFGGRSVQASSITAEPRPGDELTAEAMLPEKDRLHPRCRETIDYRKNDLAGWAQVFPNEDQQGGFVLQGYTAAPGNLCIVSICFDEGPDREWAVSTWQSIEKHSVHNR
ncbi:MAG: hypothetical protein RDV48_29400 [Candidatus Eremiobacteraeota bacterium]|nr:hypothetical protein [Candidatus Eremiobacteraeota bacterium]